MEFSNIKWLPTSGWWTINILIPVIGPVFFLWAFGFPRSTAPLASNNVIKSIGKGELLWAVMGMAAATCSDLVALQGIATVAAWKDSIWLAFGLHIFLIVISVVAVGLNSLDLPAGYIPANPHIPDNRIFVMSGGGGRKNKIETLKKTVKDKQAIIDGIKKCLVNAKSGGANCLKEVE